MAEWQLSGAHNARDRAALLAGISTSQPPPVLWCCSGRSLHHRRPPVPRQPCVQHEGSCARQVRLVFSALAYKESTYPSCRIIIMIITRQVRVTFYASWSQLRPFSGNVNTSAPRRIALPTFEQLVTRLLTPPHPSGTLITIYPQVQRNCFSGCHNIANANI